MEYDSELVQKARELRKTMTSWESHLWYDFLCTLRPRFLRQKPIGHYIADFYCSACKLVIELDGGQHFEPDALEYDRIRNAFMKNMGLTILRFPNSEVEHNFEGVCRHVLTTIKRLEGTT